MAVVDLTGIPIRRSAPRAVEFGGVLTPALGGPVQRIDRLGDRWAWTFETTPMLIEPHGRRWAAALMQARRDGARLRVSQPGLAIGSPGTPVVAAATASGRSVPLSGLAAGYVIRRGQWLSIEVAGQRYLDIINDDVTADIAGGATVQLRNLIRVQMPQGSPVRIAEPKIEGWINDLSEWPLEANRTTAFIFTIEEAA